MLKKRNAMLLQEALFALMIYMSIVTLLFGLLIHLAQQLDHFNHTEMERIKQWQQTALLIP